MRWLWRGSQAMALLLVLGVAMALIQGCHTFGRRAEGARLARMERSPQWNAGRFHNLQRLVKRPMKQDWRNRT
jgi:hypothetical protein